MRSQNKLLEIH